MDSLKRVRLAGIALVVWATPATAQHLDSAVAALPLRRLVQVQTADSGRFYGTLMERTPDSLALTPPRGTELRRVGTDDIETLWVRRGTKWLPVGVAGGITIGLLTFALQYGMYDGPVRWDGVMAATGIGFVAGAAIGAIIPTWRQVYP